MFAEEVAGNAARKRQQEAKARRRRLKAQQERRSTASTPSSSSTSASNKKESSDSAVKGTSAASLSTSSILVTAPSSIPTTSTTESTRKNSTVVNALHQRQLRQITQQQTKWVVKIQSFFRAHVSNCKLLKDQAGLLAKRLKDLMMLSNLLKQKSNTDYIPPPATVTALVRQHLFLTKSLPYRRNKSGGSSRIVVFRTNDDVLRTQQLLRFVILPGLLGADPELDPIQPWLNHPTRLTDLVRVAMVVAVKKRVQSPVLESVDAFMRAVLGLGAKTARPDIVDECRFRMLPLTPLCHRPNDDAEKEDNQAVPHLDTGADLDLLHIVRNHLLFGNGNPIPQNADKERDGCFSNSERVQGDTLFLLALDAVCSARDRRRLQVRFVTEIMTVPLITWKTTAKSLSTMIGGHPKPIVLALVEALVAQHGASLSAGKIGSVLPTVQAPMASCPATNTQCLFANLIQIGRICPSLNGSEKTNYEDAAKFFNFLATLLDVVPLGTLSTARESAIEWVSDGKSHLSAVVLSPVVLEQCKLILVDSFVRELFHRAIDDGSLNTDKILTSKNDKDLKLEKDLTSTTTAAALAAKEARVDRSKKFWQSSNWGRKLKKGVTKLLSGDNPPQGMQKGGGGSLVNTSSVSRELATGKRSVATKMKPKNDAVGSNSTKTTYSTAFLFALSRAYSIILARWGGGGGEDIVNRPTTEEALRFKKRDSTDSDASRKQDPCTMSLLNVLCFSTALVKTTWAIIQSNPSVVNDLYAVIDENKSSSEIRLLVARPKWTANAKEENGPALLLLFLSCLAHALIITDDVEIHDMDRPLPIHQIRRCIQLLKKLLYRACCVDVAISSTVPSRYFGLALIAVSARTMRDLYDRSSRRPLCVPKVWLLEDLLEKDIRRCKSHGDYYALISTPVLRLCPFLVSFKRRLKLFERIVTTNRIDIQGQHNNNPFVADSGLKPGIPVSIKRGRILEDGLRTMNNLGKSMRQRIVVHYLNEAGAQEAGVDVGGLFKEFWTDLCALAFNQNYALFRVTEGSGQYLYPNPSSGAAHGATHITLFEFLGRILGKALYEGITIQPQFAHFFLSFLRGDYNFLHMLPDLSTMDPQLYNNLMFLKTYDGDAEDLALTFTIANNDFGVNKEIPLIPNGANIPVTNTNKQRYIGLVAKYHVCDRVKEQSQAFTRGLWEVVDKSWLRIFNEPELQVLISGPSDGGVDVADMRSNTRYAGGFTGLDRTVNRFWKVVDSFNNDQQGMLLRFVTSCERPPPLGFASMNPPFTIQRVGIMRDGDKLPTASTCFNTLKLPTYSSEKVLRQRLLYAIEAGAGFELT